MDYSGKNLQGCSFKGKNLEGKKFINANIKGADFTGANIRGADFRGTQAGIPNNWVILLLITSLLILGISVSLSGLSAIFNINVILTDGFVDIARLLFLYVVLFLVAIYLNLLTGLAMIGIPAVASIILAAITILYFSIDRGNSSLTKFSYANLDFIITFGASAAVTLGAIIFAAIAFAINIAVVAGKKKYIVVSVFGIVATTFVFLQAIIPVGQQILNIEGAESKTEELNFVIIATLAVIILGAYLGWRVLKGDKKNPWIRSLAIAFASTKGTSFREANLADANFTGATLKSTDFRKAILTRTNFNNANQIYLARSGTTYLQNLQVRQLIITGEGQNKNFDRLDLRGVNLQGANLENASFIDADFYQANLQKANLSRTILVRANFERADLRGANLTGSCIQDWVITESTKLNEISCDYVYLRWIDGDKRDQMPPRGQFKENGFVTFLRYILETVDLYHEKDINPKLALTVLQKMSRDYDEPLNIVALGKIGERVFIQVKVSENIVREDFKEDYYSQYDNGLKLWSGNIHNLPPTVDSFIEKRINEIASEKTDDFVFVDTTYVEGNFTQTYQGEVNMSGDRNIQLGSGNYNERIQGDYNQNSGITQNLSGGTMYGGMQAPQGDGNNQTMDNNVVSSEHKQILSEAAAEIQQLLEQLEKSYATDTINGKMALATEAIAQIENNPILTARIFSPLKVGSVKSFEQFLSHPAASFVIKALEDWEKTKGS